MQLSCRHVEIVIALGMRASLGFSSNFKGLSDGIAGALLV
jgi:hypothetical protein